MPIPRVSPPLKAATWFSARMPTNCLWIGALLLAACGTESSSDPDSCDGGPCGGGTATGSTDSGGSSSSGGLPGTGGQLTGGSGGAEAGESGGTPGTGGEGAGGLGSGGLGSGGLGTGGLGSGGLGTGGLGSGGLGSGGGGDDLCDVGVWDGSPPEILSLSGSLGTHDPAVIEANGVYYRFDTGYLIPSFTSTNLTNWTSAGSVYSAGSYPPGWLADYRSDHSWTDAANRDPWAPDIAYFGGKYHLYSSNSLFFGDNISCISHLTKTDLASGNWEDHGPIVCTNGSENFNAIDPEVEVDEDGTPWLAFGSFWSAAIQAIQLGQDGNRVGTDFHHLAHASSIEGPTLVRRCGYYYLFVTHGLCCPNETDPARHINAIDYRTVVGRSQNILGPYVDKNGTALTQGGGTLMVEGSNTSGVDSPYAAAGHGDVFVSGDMFYHAYHAYPYDRNPYAELRIVEMPFDEEGWPVPASAP